MGSHETYSTESEWYTPAYVFKALECFFDMDVAAPIDSGLTCVPAMKFISRDSLTTEWEGFVWCNPPWAGRGNKDPWIDKMIQHGNGLLLSPDRSSAPWWQKAAWSSDGYLSVKGKIKFMPGPGNFSNWRQPGTGTTIFAWGNKGISALLKAQSNGLGIAVSKINKMIA